MLNTRQQTIALARDFVTHLPGQYAVAQAILFGSQARGDAHAGSDTDLAIILRGDPKQFIDTKLALADAAYDFLLASGVHIQPLPIWESDWLHPENHANPRLLHNIASEGVPITL